jgi:hypothetical protein
MRVRPAAAGACTTRCSGGCRGRSCRESPRKQRWWWLLRVESCERAQRGCRHRAAQVAGTPAGWLAAVRVDAVDMYASISTLTRERVQPHEKNPPPLFTNSRSTATRCWSRRRRAARRPICGRLGSGERRGFCVGYECFAAAASSDLSLDAVDRPSFPHPLFCRPTTAAAAATRTPPQAELWLRRPQQCVRPQ